MDMGRNYFALAAAYTAISLIGLSWRVNLALDKVMLDGSITDEGVQSIQGARILELLLDSCITMVLLVNLALNIFVLITLCIKTLFFGRLSSLETRKLVERLINYIVYKATFLPLIVQPDIFEAALWSTWFAVLCSLKMFQGLARDRLERLNASPSTTTSAYFRVFSVLLLVLVTDSFWIRLCMMIYKASASNTYLLLLFEPLSIAFETLQAIMVHGFQLIDTWDRHSADNNADCQGSLPFDRATAGSLWEWKWIAARNFGFLMDLLASSMALGHYVQIWWLHGLAFHLVDAVLFLNIHALASEILKKINVFVKLRSALNTLQGALPDATVEELDVYADECAICREPMARAKKLSCNHLFHLSCLRSWLDQGHGEVYSCPTCRRPLFSCGSQENTNLQAGQVSEDVHLARQMASGMDPQRLSGHPDTVFLNQQQNPSGSSAWRGVGLDGGWVHTWPRSGLDGAGPSSSNMRPVGIGKVQMMMRHLAAVSGTYAHTALEDAAWSLWPPMPATNQGGGSPSPASSSLRYQTNNSGGIHFRSVSTSSSSTGGNDIFAMAERVREVLPNIPSDIIFEDLQRTNSVAVTVNNLLQMLMKYLGNLLCVNRFSCI
ncbi:E3 ubiquitin protein ligase RIN2 isoform X3 [Amborella trichopoda]|uniref:E3 ubiquitin protein ligase RIN2 isoform X3 n=1 Tax=Amborella trichopoda TaxID=13333 RepID=UPI0005D3C8E5|nr:E3 ubiquitin protein ligase RIN2 isoform X3 [Amborella trichopoda]|eukprot:XP_011624432.1 E3 ubiquitin protein ligase RIN2 isoform X3 [Amborella trichopoda]